MSRIWRDGQLKDVYIYRLITASTIEEKIYQRQISKTSLSGCVVDTNTSRNNIKLSNEELKDLFRIEDDISECLTHEMIKCKCIGNGEIPSNDLKENNSGDEENDNKMFRIKMRDNRKSGGPSKMNELMDWEHFKSPLPNNVLDVNILLYFNLFFIVICFES